MKKLSCFCVLLLVIVILLCACNSNKSADMMKDNALLSKAPYFACNTGKMVNESETSAIIEFNGVSKEQFEDYKVKCENEGFYLDGFVSSEYYIASDEAGYMLTVAFAEGKMMIEVDTPK